MEKFGPLPVSTWEIHRKVHTADPGQVGLDEWMLCGMPLREVSAPVPVGTSESSFSSHACMHPLHGARGLTGSSAGVVCWKVEVHKPGQVGLLADHGRPIREVRCPGGVETDYGQRHGVRRVSKPTVRAKMHFPPGRFRRCVFQRKCAAVGQGVHQTVLHAWKGSYLLHSNRRPTCALH